MNIRKSIFPFALTIGVYLIIYYLPVEKFGLDNFIGEALYLAKWYAREHFLLCLVPAFFIAGAISIFISQASVLKYLGPKAGKITSYGVASVSGSILAVCSCTILPLFAGIYRMGAGIGPATAFLYAGPAVNLLAIVLTARILGAELGFARAIGAILFSLIIGLAMHLFFGREKRDEIASADVDTEPFMNLKQSSIFFASMAAILVFANWSGADDSGISYYIYSYKWIITSAAAIGLAWILIAWLKLSKIKVLLTSGVVAALAFFFNESPTIAFTAGSIGLSYMLLTAKPKNEQSEASDWFESSWDLAKQILPLLLIGVLIAGALMGRPESSGLIPSGWIASFVGGNSIGANLFASVAGAFMYFATLTEVPIIQGLLANGMGKGPALALLLAGPALSLPNMLVIRSILGTKKTITFIGLVIIMATISGLIYGSF